MVEEKAVLRKNLMNKRDGLAPSEIVTKSQRIRDHLFRLSEFKKAKTIMFYASINSEVNTLPMIKEVLSMNKRIILPLVEREETILKPYFITDYNTQLKKGMWGILEPKEAIAKSASLKEIDLVIVPGVGFDTGGQRLGYGKGFYDKFLAQLTGTPFIGLAFELQLTER